MSAFLAVLGVLAVASFLIRLPHQDDDHRGDL